MFRIATIFLLILFQSFSVYFFSQVPVNEKLMVRISKEIWVGGTVHSSGLALNYGMSKFKTFKKKSLINVDLVNINHDKEYKIFGSFDENAKKFVSKWNNVIVRSLKPTEFNRIIVKKFKKFQSVFSEINLFKQISIDFKIKSTKATLPLPRSSTPPPPPSR